MRLVEQSGDNQYSEELGRLKGRYFYYRTTSEQMVETESQMIDLVSRRLQQIIEGDRLQLPGFLATTRGVLTNGNQSMNGNSYGNFLEKAIIKALVPEPNIPGAPTA